jgi:CHAT domain-containing protein
VLIISENAYGNLEVRGMDEIRITAYVEILEKILSCPAKGEWKVIKEFKDYFDENMFYIMRWHAEDLSQKGDLELAEWMVLMVEELKNKGLKKALIYNHYFSVIDKILLLCKELDYEATIKINAILKENLIHLDEWFIEALELAFEELVKKDKGKENGVANAYTCFGNLIREFPLGNPVLNVEIAIFVYNLALKINTLDFAPDDYALIQNNLGIAYRKRIKGDRLNNVDLAISTYEEALKFLAERSTPEEILITKVNLGIAWSHRLSVPLKERIEISISHLSRALEYAKINNLKNEEARIKYNLSTVYVQAYDVAQEESSIEAAISMIEEVLQIRCMDILSEECASAKHVLATAYRKRKQGKSIPDLEYAIKIYQEILVILARETSPAKWAGAQLDFARALSLYLKCIQHFSPQKIKQAINAYESALKVYTPQDYPAECRLASADLADFQTAQGNWGEASTAYDQALSAIKILYQSCILLNSKIGEIREASDLPRRAAYAYAKTSSLPKAIETLEQSRARGLSESLDRDRTNLDQLKIQNEPLYTQYKEIIQQRRNIDAIERDRMTSTDRNSITPETLRNEATRLRQELTTTIDQIRQQPGYETFLTPPTFKDVQKAVAQIKHPLIYLLTTPAGSLALIVTSSNSHSIWLDDFTDTHLTELLNNNWFNNYQKWVEANQRFQANQSEENSRAKEKANDDWFDAIDTTTHKLWAPLMGPLIEHLKKHNIDRITLIPTGYLSLLPLHAAWTKDESKPTKRRHALDDIHITYAPNAKSLTAAQDIVETLNTRDQADSILAINDPSRNLENAEPEVQSAIASFGDRSTVLKHSAATIEAVKLKLAEASIVHFACHGKAELTEPLTSGLEMSDGRLTLKDILALNLTERGGLRLAILSACETGIIGIENADEAISLPTGLLQAGVAAVIASLWSVSDLSTMLLLTKFYDLWRTHNLAPDQALRQAQIWLRDSTNAEKLAELKINIPELNPTRMAPDTARQLFHELTLENPDDRTFSHPFHWAAFGYTGI